MKAEGRCLLLIDLDDTIYDRTPHRFGVSLEGKTGLSILQHFDTPSLLEHVETIRFLGPMFEELGYASTQHRIEPRMFLACIVVLFAPIREISKFWSISQGTLKLVRRFVAQRRQIGFSPPTWSAFLAQNLMVHRIMSGPEAATTRRTIDQLISSDEIVRLARRTTNRATWESRDGFVQLWSDLIRSGVDCYIASEGEEDLQAEKLSRMGLGSEFRGSLLTSQRASLPADARGFVSATDRLFAETAQGLPEDSFRLDQSGHLDSDRLAHQISQIDQALAPLAAVRWVLGTYAHKTPGFYARIIHAVVARPEDPLAALDDFAMIPSSAWRRKDVRIAMLGNYHAKDVVPVQQLLGREHVWTGLLDEGIHRGIRPPDVSFVPNRIFPSWSAVVEELHAGLAWDQMQPVRDVRPDVDPAVVDLVNRASRYSSFLVITRLAQFLNQ